MDWRAAWMIASALFAIAAPSLAAPLLFSAVCMLVSMWIGEGSRGQEGPPPTPTRRGSRSTAQPRGNGGVLRDL